MKPMTVKTPEAQVTRKTIVLHTLPFPLQRRIGEAKLGGFHREVSVLLE
jgi:hypothetical protein